MNGTFQRPELVSPAGDWCALNTAVEAGADAVYFGVKDLNMRKWARNFDVLEIKKVMSSLHDSGKKGYLALNSIMYDADLPKIKKTLDRAKKAEVDAVILWDMAAFEHARELGLKIHLSTQASAANFEAVKFYNSLGAKRIVLARECGLSDIKNIIKKIQQEKLDCEVEAFIHGALCVSESGRCLLSHYSFGKSANRGQCLQPCRREYLIKDLETGDPEYILGEDYVLSPKDLCAIEFVDDLIASGINAFKIEGRMRSPEYVREVVSVYKESLDLFFSGALNDERKKELKARLDQTYNRGFTSGFYFSSPRDTGSERGTSPREKVYVGMVVDYYGKIGVAAISITNEGLEKGQEILIYGKNTPACFARVGTIQKEHRSIDKAGKGETVAIKLPFRVRRNDKVFLYRPKSGTICN